MSQSDQPPFPLNSLGLQIKAHWRKYRPRMYAELKRAGTLDEAVWQAQEQTGEAMYQLVVEKKVPHDQAWEMIREEWAFLPEEDDATPEAGAN